MGDLGGEIVRIYPDYLKEKEKCLTFLKNFEAWSTDTPRRRVKKYVKQLEQVVRRERKDVCIYIDDVYRYKSDTEFVRNVVKNSHRYVALFSEKIDELLKEVKQRLDLKPGKDYEEDALDFIEKTRLSAAADGGGGDGADGSGAMGGGAMGSSGGGGGSESASSAVEGTAAFPPQLLRRYQVLMTPPLDPTVVGLTAVGASSSSDVSGAQGPPVKKGAAAPTAAAPQRPLLQQRCPHCGVRSLALSCRSRSRTWCCAPTRHGCVRSASTRCTTRSSARPSASSSSDHARRSSSKTCSTSAASSQTAE
jgi:hypothetical protein